MPLLLLFIIVPVIEILLFIEIGDKIGAFWTIVSVLGTAFLGTYLVRRQGLAAWNKAQHHMQHQQLPLEEVFTGLCLLVAGALLLTPGFLTDAIGFTLLIPPFRKSLGSTIWSWVRKNGHISGQMRAGRSHFHTSSFGHMHNHPHKPSSSDTHQVIDGDYENLDKPEK